MPSQYLLCLNGQCSKGSMSEERKVILLVLRRHGVTGGAELDDYFYAYD